jgi:hypothetical protein
MTWCSSVFNARYLRYSHFRGFFVAIIRATHGNFSHLLHKRLWVKVTAYVPTVKVYQKLSAKGHKTHRAVQVHRMPNFKNFVKFLNSIWSAFSNFSYAH